ncbi:MAG: hypothetical protein RIR11_4188 [Bacteroidota bacterium]|jgi:hypothetical protein
MNIPANLSPYWVLLKDLSPKEKLSLIEILAKSIQSGSDTSKKGNKKIKSPNLLRCRCIRILDCVTYRENCSGLGIE